MAEGIAFSLVVDGVACRTKRMFYLLNGVVDGLDIVVGTPDRETG